MNCYGWVKDCYYVQPPCEPQTAAAGPCQTQVWFWIALGVVTLLAIGGRK